MYEILKEHCKYHGKQQDICTMKLIQLLEFIQGTGLGLLTIESIDSCGESTFLQNYLQDDKVSEELVLNFLLLVYIFIILCSVWCYFETYVSDMRC